jgi:hypothetical protein
MPEQLLSSSRTSSTGSKRSVASILLDNRHWEASYVAHLNFIVSTWNCIPMQRMLSMYMRFARPLCSAVNPCDLQLVETLRTDPADERGRVPMNPTSSLMTIQSFLVEYLTVSPMPRVQCPWRCPSSCGSCRSRKISIIFITYFEVLKLRWKHEKTPFEDDEKCVGVSWGYGFDHWSPLLKLCSIRYLRRKQCSWPFQPPLLALPIEWLMASLLEPLAYRYLYILFVILKQ